MPRRSGRFVEPVVVEEATEHRRGRDATARRQALAILMNRYNAQVSSLTGKAANITALAVLAAVIGCGAQKLHPRVGARRRGVVKGEIGWLGARVGVFDNRM